LLDGVVAPTPGPRASRFDSGSRKNLRQVKTCGLKIAQIVPVFPNLLTRYRDTAARGFIQG
jgi:hypothetical protein